MEADNIASKLESFNVFVEKWTLIFLILSLYLFFSFKIINLLYPSNPAVECGTGFFAVLILHVFFAAIALSFLFFKMFRHAMYTRPQKAISFVVVLMPVAVSFWLF